MMAPLHSVPAALPVPMMMGRALCPVTRNRSAWALAIFAAQAFA